MRNMKKWLVLLLAVVMLVSNLPVTAMATENWAPLALETCPAGGGILQVDILATEGSIVADGKLAGIFAPDASDADYGLAMSGVTEGGKV